MSPRLLQVPEQQQQSEQPLLEKMNNTTAQADDSASFGYLSSHDPGEESVTTVDDHKPKTRDERREIERLVWKEVRNVSTCKSCFFFFMALASAVFICMGYAIFNSQQRYRFESDFHDSARTLEAAAHYQLTDLYKASVLVSETLIARTTNASDWPFVTFPDYEFTASQARRTFGSEWICFAPLLANSSQLETWNPYSVENQDWIAQSLQIQGNSNSSSLPLSIPEQVYVLQDQGGGTQVRVEEVGQSGFPIAPLWQMSPPPVSGSVKFRGLTDPALHTPGVNFNGLSASWLQVPFNNSLLSTTAVELTDGTQAVQDLQLTIDSSPSKQEGAAPFSMMVTPIQQQPLGLVLSLLRWNRYLESPAPIEFIQVVLRSSCDADYVATFEWTTASGEEAVYLGPEDLHDELFSDLEFVISMDPNSVILNSGGNADAGSAEEPQRCVFSFSVYPTEELWGSYSTKQPLIAAVVAGLLMLALTIAFFVYEYLASLKEEKIIQMAVRSNTIISTLFPANVRDRLFAEQDYESEQDRLKTLMGMPSSQVPGAGARDSDDESEDADLDIFSGKPIADLFTDTTILFADIVGFTAWSSVREPVQVFTLLETLYHAFDKIAEQRRVFKVETVGDCYVAVTGLPDPRPDHAIVMCRFATNCMHKMVELTTKLEVELGPDTGELSMRFGLHSGPVTAGVLRGQRSRFQLFGDTMNTASRMETTSQRGRIQISGETADLIVAAGKSHWIEKRPDLVFAKGKGEMQTFWLLLGQQGTGGSTVGGSAAGGLSVASGEEETGEEVSQDVKKIMEARTARLVEWACEVLRKLLMQIAARRDASRRVHKKQVRRDSYTESRMVYRRPDDRTVVEEVCEVITLPGYDENVALRQRDSSAIALGPKVEEQLKSYVMEIASMYRENPFHDFEHVCHVVMSAQKLLSRIVRPKAVTVYEDDDSEGGDDSAKQAKGGKKKGDDIQKFMDSIQHDAIGAYIKSHKKKKKKTKTLHDHTYGITSDPLTQFACIFSALIHDVDHTGVPNGQLIKENPALAATYKSKSVAEQISVDLSWNRLMDEDYYELRQAIYCNESELQRFRQLVVNSVMATDIMDKELKALRNARWDVAFAPENAQLETSVGENVNRKATIVIEHLIQASDVSHTMQHWHVYRQWNEKLFREMSWAFVEGRAEKDPADFWYNGEIGFFDFYIIPLAKKLKNCGVFGVSSAEYLNYALLNRQEWELRGKEVVAEMAENFKNERAEKQRLENEAAVSVANLRGIMEAGE